MCQLKRFMRELWERQRMRVLEDDMDWILDTEVYFDMQQVEACLMDSRECKLSTW